MSKSDPIKSESGNFWGGNVTWDDKEDREYTRCDMKEYKFLGAKKSLVIVEQIAKVRWSRKALAGRAGLEDMKPPFCRYIWVYPCNVVLLLRCN